MSKKDGTFLCGFRLKNVFLGVQVIFAELQREKIRTVRDSSMLIQPEWNCLVNLALILRARERYQKKFKEKMDRYT
jgi:hypothetical protein